MYLTLHFWLEMTACIGSCSYGVKSRISRNIFIYTEWNKIYRQLFIIWIIVKNQVGNHVQHVSVIMSLSRYILPTNCSSCEMIKPYYNTCSKWPPSVSSATWHALEHILNLLTSAFVTACLKPCHQIFNSIGRNYTDVLLQMTSTGKFWSELDSTKIEVMCSALDVQSIFLGMSHSVAGTLSHSDVSLVCWNHQGFLTATSAHFQAALVEQSSVKQRCYWVRWKGPMAMFSM